MISDTDEKLLNQLGLGQFNLNLPSTHFPTPDQKDYDSGFVTRYFVGKRNEFKITETSARDFGKINDNFFLKTTIEWRISGDRNNTYNGKMLITPGVEEYNKKEISKANKILPGINKILTNYLQFWRGF